MPVCRRFRLPTRMRTCLRWRRPWREFRWRAGQKHYSASVGRRPRVGMSSTSRGWSSPGCCTLTSIGRCTESVRNRSCWRWGPTVLSTNTFRTFCCSPIWGQRVVDVKPALRLSKPEVAATFAWTRAALERRGWMYEVWSEPNEVELENLRFLAGFRRPYLFDPALLAALRRIDPDGASIAEVIGGMEDWPLPLTRSALFHLLWSQEFAVDLCRPLRSSSTLTRELWT